MRKNISEHYHVPLQHAEAETLHSALTALQDGYLHRATKLLISVMEPDPPEEPRFVDAEDTAGFLSDEDLEALVFLTYSTLFAAIHAERDLYQTGLGDHLAPWYEYATDYLARLLEVHS